MDRLYLDSASFTQIDTNQIHAFMVCSKAIERAEQVFSLGQKNGKNSNVKYDAKKLRILLINMCGVRVSENTKGFKDAFDSMEAYEKFCSLNGWTINKMCLYTTEQVMDLESYYQLLEWQIAANKVGRGSDLIAYMDRLGKKDISHSTRVKLKAFLAKSLAMQ